MLQPCKHCGGKGYSAVFAVRRLFAGYKAKTSVVCSRCFYETRAYHTHEQAIREWNRPIKSRDKIKRYL